MDFLYIPKMDSAEEKDQPEMKRMGNLFDVFIKENTYLLAYIKDAEDDEVPTYKQDTMYSMLRAFILWLSKLPKDEINYDVPKLRQMNDAK